jgi:hypothetical protein
MIPDSEQKIPDCYNINNFKQPKRRYYIINKGERWNFDCHVNRRCLQERSENIAKKT